MTRHALALAAIAGAFLTAACAGRPVAVRTAPASPASATAQAAPAAAAVPAPPKPAPQLPALPPLSGPSWTEVVSPRLDVSLATDQSSVALLAGDYLIRAADGRAERRRGPLRFSSPASAPVALFVVQALSLGSRDAAEKEAARLSAALGLPGSVAEGSGRFAVRLGPPAERSSADSTLKRVRREAAPDAFLVGASAAPASATILVEEEDAEPVEAASPLEIAASRGEPLPGAEGTHRGHFLVRATGRGTVHWLNRVSLEDYLRGVVPAEMGPRVYDELEALKAQAIAARSYAVRHLGDFAAEGYDLCASPRCQVYQGVRAEQPLSDQAVRETAGEVLVWNGAVADTLFTSTCGGRTEKAEEVFPGYAALDVPYLAPVLCSGESPMVLATARRPAKDELSLLAFRGRALFAALGRSDTTPESLSLARNELRARLGLGAARSLGSLWPAAVYADLLDLAAVGEPELLLEEPEVAGAPPALTGRARSGWAVATRFQLGNAAPLPFDRRLSPEEAAGLWATLLLRTGGLEEAEGRLLALEDGVASLKTAKGRMRAPLARDAALFRGAGDGFVEAGSLLAHPGDRFRAILRDGEIRALALAGPPAAGTYERDSAWVHWTRRFTGSELAAKLRERDPSQAARTVRKLEVLERSPGGRAKKVRVSTDAGALTLTGLEIRLSLTLPENLFTLSSGRDTTTGEAVFTFYGRGWGHGVGLCQNGAFGMALAGKTYREILAKYYPGAAVAPLPVPPG